MAYKKSSEELRKKPTKRKTNKRPVNSKKSEAGNEIYSHSKDNSFDLSSMGNRAKNKKSKRNLLVCNVLLSLVLVVSSVLFIGTSLLESQIL
ncbi:MAG: hypothetical protein IIU65_05530, partial [Clostridia bacterium]|nr:hypothetical protein [Clostridia bacterium]